MRLCMTRVNVKLGANRVVPVSCKGSAQKKGKRDKRQKSALPRFLSSTVTSVFPTARRGRRPTYSSALKKARLTEMGVDGGGAAMRDISQPVTFRAVRPVETWGGGGARGWICK